MKAKIIVGGASDIMKLKYFNDEEGDIGDLISLKGFPRESYSFIKCFGCGKYWKGEYRLGTLPCNKDEYYYSWCDVCDDTVYFEPNFDLGKRKFKYLFNALFLCKDAFIIAQTEYSKIFTNEEIYESDYRKVPDTEINEIMKRCKVFDIELGEKFYFNQIDIEEEISELLECH